MLTQTTSSQKNKNTLFRVLRQITYTKLFKKYSSGNFSYHKILANNLVFNDTCHVVARFKDYLIFDDNTEFLRRFYTEEESSPRLKRILTFYETYSKIFPNYMILKESKYLYRNIRKKQKMIDAVNEIKREEEENRKKIKQGGCKINKENNNNELFTSKVKEEIKSYQKNAADKKKNNNNAFDSENEEDTLFNQNSISISLLSRKAFNENMGNENELPMISPRADIIFKTNSNNIIDKNNNKDDNNTTNTNDSFIANETNHSISGILNIMNDNKIYITDLQGLIEINNFSKTSQQLKKSKNKISRKVEKKSPEKQTSKKKKFIITKENTNKDNDNNNDKFPKKKVFKKNELYHKQNQKNILSSSNLTSTSTNYFSNKGLKKIITPSSNAAVMINTNTEKNIHEINNYQNIILPKGNTVININNNYYEQISPESKEQNKNNNTNLKKANTKNNCGSTKNSNINQNSEKKIYKFRDFKKNNNTANNNTSNNNTNNNVNQIKKYRTKKNNKKPISQDFDCHKFLESESGKLLNEKLICSTNNLDENNPMLKESKTVRDKITKFASLSPQPTISPFDNRIKENIIQNGNYNTNENNIKNNLKDINEGIIRRHKNYFTENNDPNLITGDTKINDDNDEDNIEREKLLYNLRDLIENKKKKKKNEDNEPIKIETYDEEIIIEKLNYTKQKTDINFKNDSNNSNNKIILYRKNYSSSKNTTNYEKENEIENVEKESNSINHNIESSSNNNIELPSKKSIVKINKEKTNKNEENEGKVSTGTNIKKRTRSKITYKKLPVKEKKARTKGILKNTYCSNNNLHENNNDTKNKINLKKNIIINNNNTANNFFDSSTHNVIANTIQSSENLIMKKRIDKQNNNKLYKKNQFLNNRNIKNNNKNLNMDNNHSVNETSHEKGFSTLSHSILMKSPNSQFKKILSSHKKDDNNYQNMTVYESKKKKYYNHKNDLLNSELYNQSINKSCAGINNYIYDSLNYNTNDNNNNTHNHINKSLKTENNCINPINKTHKITYTEMKNKYKSFLLKKNKQKSCDLDSQSYYTSKMNQDLLERINVIKKNNQNQFYKNINTKNKLSGQIITNNNHVENFQTIDNISCTNRNMNSSTNLKNNKKSRTIHCDENCNYQTPCVGQKKIGLYKKPTNKQPKLMKTEKKNVNPTKSQKNFNTPGAIKVNRSKFLGKPKDKPFAHTKIHSNYNFCLKEKSIEE